MAYKRRSRPNEGYRVEPTLPQPWGRVGAWQTGFRNRRDAERVEAWLFEQARKNPILIDALVRGDFTLSEVWIADLRGTLQDLLDGIKDRRLEEAVEAYRLVCKDRKSVV